MPLSCPECGDDVCGVPIPDFEEGFWDGEPYPCDGCGLLWRVSADGEGCWIPDQDCPGCGADPDARIEVHPPGCAVVTLDRGYDWGRDGDFSDWPPSGFEDWLDLGGEA